MKNLFFIFCLFFACTNLIAQNKKPDDKDVKPVTFYKSETPTFIIEVTNAQPMSFLREAQNKILQAEAFFSKIFRMPSGMLTGNVNENSIAFTKFAEKLKSETKFGGKVPKNIYEEWFNLSGKISFKIWDKQALFADEWFDLTKVKQEDRARQGIPGAYYAWGRMGTSDDGKDQLGKRIIRSYVGNREPKEVIASLYHELGHLYLSSYLMEFGGGTPAWLSEGFAELFAYALPSDKKTKRQIEKNKAILYEVVQTGEFWKFDSFLEVNNAHNLKLVADKSAKSEIIYKQSWSVVEFLTSSPAYSTKFLNFLDILRLDHFEEVYLKRQKTTMFDIQKTAFKKAFGTEMSNLEKYWVKHVNIRYKSDLDKHPEYNFYIGDFYLRRGNIEKAELFFALAAEKAPKFSESHLGLGRLAYTRKKYADSSLHFEDAVKADPENSEAYTWLGYSYIATGKFKEANEKFEKGYELDSDDEDLLNGYGLSLFYTENYEKSAKMYEKNYEKTKNQNYLFGQAKSLFMQKEYTSSRRLFSALSTTMDHPEIPFWIGAASAFLKDKEYALSELAKATKTNHRYVNYAKAFVEALNNDQPLPEVKP